MKKDPYAEPWEAKEAGDDFHKFRVLIAATGLATARDRLCQPIPSANYRRFLAKG